MSMIESIMAHGRAAPRTARTTRRRETVPASDLVVGVQCGGSDAFSGVTANPAVGFCTDLLVRAGATVMFSEVTEVRDGIDQLTSRAVNADVAAGDDPRDGVVRRLPEKGSVDRSANTTPGNKKGGLSNIVEKAMGSIVKSGTAPISGVLSPGEKLKQKGLIYAATPASDFICGTLAAGRGHQPARVHHRSRHALRPGEVPVIKVATRNDLARRWHDLMDINAGRSPTGEATIEDVGWELFQPDARRGEWRKKTWAEQ